MSSRTFIILGNAAQLDRELQKAFPEARIVQTGCLGHTLLLTDPQNARILVAQEPIRACCIKGMNQWLSETSSSQGRLRSIKPRIRTRRAHCAANNAWADRARLMSFPGVHSRVTAFFASAKEHDHEWFTVQDTAQTLGLSVRHLARLVKQEVGYSPQIILHLARIDSVARAIERSRDSISTIAILHRFPTLPTMIHQFRQYVGESPGQYRRRRCAHMA